MNPNPYLPGGTVYGTLLNDPGMLAALGEALPGWKLGAGALVLSGLAVIVLWPRLQTKLARG